jgi:hypothetical protein
MTISLSPHRRPFRVPGAGDWNAGTAWSSAADRHISQCEVWNAGTVRWPRWGLVGLVHETEAARVGVLDRLTAYGAAEVSESSGHRLAKHRRSCSVTDESGHFHQICRRDHP